MSVLLLRFCKASKCGVGAPSWVSGGATVMMESSSTGEMASENCDFVLCRQEVCEGDRERPKRRPDLAHLKGQSGRLDSRE